VLVRRVVDPHANLDQTIEIANIFIAACLSSMSIIMTASWSSRLPGGATPIGISRGTPRGRSGFRRFPDLFPGPWFRSVEPETYLCRYAEILALLNPAAIRDRLLAFGGTPVLLCFERATDIQAGR
jgi:hypothetical protein